ncbi:cell division protein ZapD [Xenophilus arseniciresistens]|uniref:Cell division protein ZapD n=1 Tax=Xenophilus arseniciresistens TaxID=1283306 RepID=A0AAE3SZ36_9BURK|nr:cell division protein ZapD [Xenophilus arseniciresistens]MDA7416732.1 cell division protein ZapD [Xenophilus arseniciresistens]
MILYEYPFNERIRTYLRLEHLLQRLGELITSDSALSHHYALVTLFEIMDVAARADLKADVLRDLDKHKATLVSYRGNPAIQEAALEQIIARLEKAFASLNAMTGKAGLALTDNEWLMAIRSRAGIPAGTCGFDLPAYYAWQHHPVQRRRQDLERWVGTLAPLAEGVVLLLQLLRDTDVPYRVVAPNGQFQQTLPQGRSFQLLRLRIDPKSGLVPEISGNRLMVSVRLMREDAEGRLQPSHEDAAFELTLCA